ncbi:MULTISPECIES: hypothetical protein [unclassified Pseudonocardia]|nr:MULTISPECIES: hypothetical protein [unclassified Pseudonocardia]MBN9098533.1 hypothetical protein [Pseudonocardia sp.]
MPAEVVAQFGGCFLLNATDHGGSTIAGYARVVGGHLVVGAPAVRPG